MLHEKNRKSGSDVAEQLERIADNLYHIAEQLGELNIHTKHLDITLQETRDILDHLKVKKAWLFWKS